MDYFIQENTVVALVLFCQEVKLGHGLGLEFPLQMTCSNPVQTNFRPKIFDYVSICATGPEITCRGAQIEFKINKIYRQYGLFHILGRKECYKTVAESGEICKPQSHHPDFFLSFAVFFWETESRTTVKMYFISQQKGKENVFFMERVGCGDLSEFIGSLNSD